MVCYAYQFFYIPVPWILRGKKIAPKAPHDKHYAVMICGRNEEHVIGDLIDSLRRQTYDQSKISIFVMADNCTDRTADVCREKGVNVYERFNTELVGKGYAMNELMRHIAEDYPDGFDAYFVFDADNILRDDYVEQMHNTFCAGNDIVTSYRNSKNYGDNWITAGYSLWFIRESRYLSHSRYLLGTSCAISGTGFMFSRKVAEETGPWPYYLLTEDIQMSVDQITKGRKIAFASGAMFYDEQPVKFSQSWRQRKRWSRGFLQVIRDYGWKMVKGVFRGSFSCYDMLMAIAPAYLLTVVSLILNVVFITKGLLSGGTVLAALASLAGLLGLMYASVFFVGAVATVTEWKYIHTSSARKIVYMFTFPFFMMTYLPISIASLFGKVEWKPINHSKSVKSMREASNGADELSEMMRAEAGGDNA